MKLLIPKAVRKLFSDIASKLMYLNFSSIPKSYTSPNFQKKKRTLVFVLMMLILFCLFCFAAFICHHNCFLVYGSLEDPTVAKWSRIIHVSTLASVLISILFSTCGYLTFTGYTQGKMRDSVSSYFAIHMEWFCHFSFWVQLYLMFYSEVH